MEGDRPDDSPRADEVVPPVDSRERMVDAAVALVVEHYDRQGGLREVFAYLTPGAVAARAGLSRALLYHHWGDTEADGSGAFESFLAEVADRLWELPAVPEELAELAALLPANLSELIPALCDHELDRATGEVGAMFRAAQAMTLHGVLPEHAGDETVRRLGVLYEHLGARLGREPLPPLTFEDLASAVSSTIEGFALVANVLPSLARRRYDWDPGVPVEQPGDTWSLLSIAVEGIIDNMTRPVAVSGRGGGTPPR